MLLDALRLIFVDLGVADAQSRVYRLAETPVGGCASAGEGAPRGG
ncbi:MAG TPA: hypothetical protein VMV46_12580 [Thermoanaerobaculia bacterium]|nr:hypothetical protein [Thermoanaerobaculia bacterium]